MIVTHCKASIWRGVLDERVNLKPAACTWLNACEGFKTFLASMLCLHVAIPNFCTLHDMDNQSLFLNSLFIIIVLEQRKYQNMRYLIWLFVMSFALKFDCLSNKSIFNCGIWLYSRLCISMMFLKPFNESMLCNNFVSYDTYWWLLNSSLVLYSSYIFPMNKPVIVWGKRWQFVRCQLSPWFVIGKFQWIKFGLEINFELPI